MNKNELIYVNKNEHKFASIIYLLFLWNFLENYWKEKKLIFCVSGGYFLKKFKLIFLLAK